MARHGQEPGVDVPFLTAADPVDGGAHIVIDAALRDATEHPEGMGVGIKQHLVGLQQIGSDKKGPAIAELDMRHLQLGPLIAEDGPIFGPVELERLARRKTQWHKGPATCGLHLALPIRPPFPGKGRDPIVGPVKPQADQVRMQLLEGPLLLAGPVRFRLQPGSQSVRKGVKLARPVGNLELRLNPVRPQILADSVPGQAGPATNLPDR